MNRHLRALAALCGAALSLSGCRCGKPEPVRVSPPPAAPVAASAVAAVADQSTILATLPDQAERTFVFAERGGGVAWVDEKDGRSQVVLNGRAGKPYAAVGPVVLSPDGRRWAHAAQVDGTWRMVLDGAEGQGFDELQPPVFSPDGAHLAYQARAGEAWHLVVDGAKSAGLRAPSPVVLFSADSTRVAYLADPDQQGVGRLVVSGLDPRSPVVAEARASELVASADKRWLAAVGERAGKATVIKLAFATPDRVERGLAYDAAFGPALSPDGASLAYQAERAGAALMVLDGQEAVVPPGQLFGPPVIRAGKKAVGITHLEGDKVRLLQFFAPGEPAGALVDELEAPVYSGDGRSHAYAARRGERWFVVVDGKEGRLLDRVVSPAFSPDGTRVVYRARQDGKRFVVVADLDGKTVRQHPTYEQVFPVQFTADGKAVAYGVKDGPRLRWVVEPL